MPQAVKNCSLLTVYRSQLKRCAFTLSEVLITLAIIGIIAALTIPTLIAKYNKSVIETNLKKTYAELNNIFKMAEAEHGSFTNWDFKDSNGIISTYFAPYIKLTSCRDRVKSCSKVYFGRDNIGFYAPTATSAPGDIITDRMTGYLTNDGRVFMFAPQYYEDFNGKSINILVDVNGIRGNSIMGQDVFVFSINNFRGITNKIKVGPSISWSEDCSTEYLKENCINDVPYVVYRGAACIHLLERNGWKFPEDYPIDF